MEQIEINQYFKGFPLIYLANLDKNKPHVRAMSLIYHNDDLWVCSPKSRPKVSQFDLNNDIEFCLVVQATAEYHNIRGSGKAIKITTNDVRKELSTVIPFFSAYWEEYTDPNFVLYRLDIEQYEYHPPGGKIYYKIYPKRNEIKKYSKHFRRNDEEKK